MLRPMMVQPWLNDVELVEEQLEALKLSSLQVIRAATTQRSSRVRATAGLLGARVPAGRVYERRLRKIWERAARSRTS